jgi:stalled ribosome alternative rescue factor ArfA
MVKSKELKPYRQKMEDDELQMYLHFKKRGGKSPLKKGKGSYNRQKMKREEVEE